MNKYLLTVWNNGGVVLEKTFNDLEHLLEYISENYRGDPVNIDIGKIKYDCILDWSGTE